MTGQHAIFLPTLMVNSEAGGAVSNKSSRHTLIGIPDKHKLLSLCELASSMLAVALGGFIFCQQVHTHGFCSLVRFAVCFICSFIRSVRNRIQIRWCCRYSFATVAKNTHSYYVEFPFKNHPQMKRNY